MDETVEVEAFYRNGVAMIRTPDGVEMTLADAMRSAYPGSEFDQATGLEMAMPPPAAADAFTPTAPQEDRFGDTAAYMAQPYLSDAGDIMANAGRAPTYFTDPVLGSVERVGQYTKDVGLAGLNAVAAGMYGGAGLLGDMFGGDPQKERRLARDVAGGMDVAGVGPEARMVGAITEAARPAMTRGVLDEVGRQAVDETGALKLYHGSPHDFDRFSMDKIGTGEGAQAYGHGLYFAENEGVARSYRDTLSGSTGNAQHTMLRKVMGGTTPDRVLPAMQRIYPGITADDIARLERDMETAPSPGRMYEVEIDANPEDFLDWDAPLSAQPAKVREALGPRIDALRAAGAGLPDDPIGEALWKVAHPQGGFDKTDFSRSVPEQATERFRQAGIPGIRYLDGGSRTAGDGSRNYVLFDDSLIEILRKYGFAGLLAGGAGGAAMQPGQAQAAPAGGLLNFGGGR